MFSHKSAIVTLSVAFVVAPASAQIVMDGTLRLAREAQRDVRDARIRTRMATAVKPPEASLTIGLAHDRSDDEIKFSATPFALDYKTDGTDTDWWKFQLTGDGYTRISAPGEASASGLGDLALNVYRPLASTLIGMIGLGIPTHGEVGSHEWTIGGKLIHWGDLSKDWGYSIVGRVAYQRNDTPELGSTSLMLYGQVAYSLGGDRSLGVGLSRQKRRGQGGATELGLEYAFPLAEKTDAAVSLGRGLTKGARHTAVEVDLTFRF
ncbi:MAG: hypothetical protein O9341_24925 [Paucibacter sp.]|nr:hypothetical protein [Roseateles sp.]